MLLLLTMATGKARPVLWFAPTLKTLLFALALKLLRPTTRLVVDVGDLNASLYRVTFGAVPVRVRVASRLEPVVLRLAAHVVARGAHLAEYLPRSARRRLVHIPDCAAGDVLPQNWTERRRVIGALGTVAWSSSLDWGYGFDLVEVLRRLPDRFSGIMIGDGPDLARLQDYAREIGVDNRLNFVGRVSVDQLDNSIAMAGCYLLTPPAIAPFEVRTTGKLAELVVRGHPVICTAVGTAKEVVPEGLLVTPWPEASWAQVYDACARLILGLEESAETPLLRVGVDYFRYSTYQPLVARLAGGE